MDLNIDFTLIIQTFTNQNQLLEMYLFIDYGI